MFMFFSLRRPRCMVLVPLTTLNTDSVNADVTSTENTKVAKSSSGCVRP